MEKTDLRFKVRKRDGLWTWSVISGGRVIWTSRPYSSAEESFRALEWTVDVMDVDTMRVALSKMYNSAPKWVEKVNKMSESQVVAVYFRLNSKEK